MSKRFIVQYTAPVGVFVEVSDDGEVEVTSVTVGDEYAELDERFGPGGVVNYADYAKATDRDRAYVLEHIDDYDWPVWSFG
jgi:hypothetical protein